MRFLFPLEKGVRGILDKKKISLIGYNISQRAICYIELTLTCLIAIPAAIDCASDEFHRVRQRG